MPQASFPNLTVLTHPLIQHKLSILRDRDTSTRDFKQLVSEIATLMAYEVTKDLPTEPVEIETPAGADHRPAGLGEEAHPGADPPRGARHGRGHRAADPVGPGGPHRPLSRPRHAQAGGLLLQDSRRRRWSAISSCSTRCSPPAGRPSPRWPRSEAGARRIRFLCLVAAPEGVQRDARGHPDVPVYTAALDRQLNEQGYILPGLGDAGDRLFGTRRHHVNGDADDETRLTFFGAAGPGDRLDAPAGGRRRALPARRRALPGPPGGGARR